MKNTPQKFNKTWIIFVIGLLVFSLIFWLVNYLINSEDFNNKSNTNNQVNMESDTNIIKELTWKPLPYFSPNLNMLFYYPEEWDIDKSAIYNSYNGEEEGNIVWFSSNYDSDSINDKNIGFSINKLFDSGDTFNEWIDKKIENIKDTRGTELEIEDITYNNIQIKKICNNGSIEGYPYPSCFIYLHSSPYIIEMRVDAHSSEHYKLVKDYTDLFAQRLYLLSSNDDTYKKYSSFNAGYDLLYDIDSFPLTSNYNEFSNSFGGDDLYRPFNISVITGAKNDLEKFWFNRARYQNSEFPIDLYIDGTRCLMSDISIEDDYSIIPQTEIYCLKNDKYYNLSIMNNISDVELRSIFTMLSTFEFIDDNKNIDGTYSYLNPENKYKINYPLTSEVIEENDNNSERISFYEYYDNYDALGISVSYQETDLSLEECVINQFCVLYYQSLVDYNDTTFLGYSAKERTYSDDGDRKLNIRNIVLKKDGVIYNITVTKKDGVDSTDIDDMLNSFEFL